MIEFDMEGGKEAIQDGAGNNNCFRNRGKWLAVLDHDHAISGNGGAAEVALNITNIGEFL